MTLEAHPVGERMCRCVAVHSPAQLPDEAEGHHVWPLGKGGPDTADNMRWLCPNSHTKAHALWRHFERHLGEPPWTIMRKYSLFIRAIVANGFRQAEAAQEAARRDAPSAREGESGGRVHAVRAMMSANDHDAGGQA